MVQGDSGGWSAVRSLPIRRRRGRRARKVREYSMQMPAESFFLAARHDRVLCWISLSLSFSSSSPVLLFSLSPLAVHPRLLRVHIYIPYVKARIRTARYARSRWRPCGRTPALPAYLHARYKPLSTGRLSNLDLSSSSIYTCAHYSLIHIHIHWVHWSLSAPCRAFRRGPRAALHFQCRSE